MRLITELKDKAPSLLVAGAGLQGGGAGHIRSVAPVVATPAADAVSALINLGYPPAQANAAIAAAMEKSGDGARAEDLIRMGLKELAR